MLLKYLDPICYVQYGHVQYGPSSVDFQSCFFKEGVLLPPPSRHLKSSLLYGKNSQEVVYMATSIRIHISFVNLFQQFFVFLTFISNLFGILIGFINSYWQLIRILKFRIKKSSVLIYISLPWLALECYLPLFTIQICKKRHFLYASLALLYVLHCSSGK